MIKAFSGDIGGMSFLGGVELSKPYAFAVYSDCRYPFVAVRSPMNAHESGFVAFPGFYFVLHIDSSISIAKVGYSVIGLDAVDMVDFIRPNAKHIKPCKAVELLIFIINAASEIAGFANSSYDASMLPFVTWTANKPSKNPSIRVVMEKLFKPFLGKHLTPLINRLIESAARLIRPFSGCIPSRTYIVTNSGVI
jgi:hypothetical protein